MCSREKTDKVEDAVLFAHTIIETFQQAQAQAHGESSIMSQNADVENSIAVREVIKKMENTPPTELMLPGCLERLLQTGSFATYLCAILSALPHVQSPAVLRQTIFFWGLKTFSQATLADSISVRILKNALLNSDCYLRDDDIQRLIINALNFLRSMGDSQWVASSSSLTTQPEIAAFEAFFEILVMLTSKSNESMRAQAHKALLSFNHGKWPPKGVIMIASSLHELSETEEECDSALKAISQYVHWDTSKNKSNNNIDPEDLPALFYVITSFRSKCDNSVHMKRRVASLVIRAIDSIDTKSVGAKVKMRASSSLSFTSSPSSSLRLSDGKVRSVLATVTHHMSLLMNKDQGLAAEVLRYIKNFSLLKIGDIDRTCDVSQAKLLLCFLVGRSGSMEEKVVKALCSLVREIVHQHEVRISSQWYSKNLWQEAMPIQLDKALLCIRRAYHWASYG